MTWLNICIILIFVMESSTGKKVVKLGKSGENQVTFYFFLSSFSGRTLLKVSVKKVEDSVSGKYFEADINKEGTFVFFQEKGEHYLYPRGNEC